MEQGIHTKFQPVELQLAWLSHAWVTPGLMPRLLRHMPRGSLTRLTTSLARGRSGSPLALPWWRRGKQFAGKMTLSRGKLPLTAAARALVIPVSMSRHGGRAINQAE